MTALVKAAVEGSRCLGAVAVSLVSCQAKVTDEVAAAAVAVIAVAVAAIAAAVRTSLQAGPWGNWRPVGCKVQFGSRTLQAP
jgi:hypothetical protein